MKTSEEIEQLAEKYYPPYPDGIITDEIRALREGFIKGYRCQEDTADKKFTLDDVINSIHQAELKHKKNYTEIYELMKTYLQSLNK